MAENKQCPTCGQDYPEHSTHGEINHTPIEELIEIHTGMKYEDYLKDKKMKRLVTIQKYLETGDSLEAEKIYLAEVLENKQNIEIQKFLNQS